MKNKILILLVVFMGAVVLNSCYKETSLSHEPGSEDAQYLQFTNVEGVFQMVPSDTPFTYDLGVKILGAPAASDLIVNLEVLATSTVNSDQVSLAYDTLTIHANETTGSVTLSIVPDQFPLGDSLYLDIKASASGFKNASYGGETHIGFIYNVCDYDFFDYVGAFICDEEGYGEYNVSFTPDPVIENRILNSNFWDWPAPGQTLAYDLSADDTQTIIIPDQPFTFGDDVVGSVDGTGTYDACTHTMVCDYNVWYGGSNYPTHHEFRPGSVKSTSPSWKPSYLKK